MKVRILLRHLDMPYERVTVDLFRGETRNAAHFARNPDGRVPTLELEDGTTISEAGAILLFLGEGTIYVPKDSVARSRVHQWRFFEQNRIEDELAYARFLWPRAFTATARGLRQQIRARTRRARGPRPRAIRRTTLRRRRPVHRGLHRALRLRPLRRRRRRRPTG